MPAVEEVKRVAFCKAGEANAVVLEELSSGGVVRPGSSARVPHIWDFRKNFGLVGGPLGDRSQQVLVAQVELAAKEISTSEIVHVQAD